MRIPIPFANLLSSFHHHRHLHATNKHSIIVIMGATATGKTKLSIDIAARLGSEIVNSDKIQVYSGLDITTNKVPVPERRGVPHHLLGTVDPAAAGDLVPVTFRSLAADAIGSISDRGRVPIIAGGSNSFIHALVANRYDSKSDPFRDGGPRQLNDFRYRCCFIWVDVEKTVLREYLDRRVDEMVGSGMVEELERYFGKRSDGLGAEWETNIGLNKAIGVPEFEGYFRKRVTYEEAVGAIKENTWRLAEEQVGKIRRLGECHGWELKRVDATCAVRRKLSGAHYGGDWGRDVLGPAMGAIEKFLDEEDCRLIMLPASESLY